LLQTLPPFGVGLLDEEASGATSGLVGGLQLQSCAFVLDGKSGKLINLEDVLASAAPVS
jgi:hypothetical protein